MGERVGLAVLERLSPGLEAARGPRPDMRGSAVLLDRREERGPDTRGFAVLLERRAGTGLLDRRVGAEQ